MFYNGQGFQNFASPELLYLVFRGNFISSNYMVDIGSNSASSLYLEYQENQGLSFDSDENLIESELLEGDMAQFRWDYHYRKNSHYLKLGIYYSDNESISNNYTLFDYIYKFRGKNQEMAMSLILFGV